MMIDKRLVNFTAGAKKFVFITVLLKFLALAANTVFIFCAGNELAAALSAGQGGTHFSSLPIMLLCLAAVAASNVISSRTSFRASSGVKISLRKKIYEKLLRLGAGYQESAATAKVTQLAVEGVEQIETWFSAFLPQFYFSMIAAAFTFCAIAFLNLKMALLLLACVPLIPISMALVQGIAKRILGKYWEQYANLADSFLENAQGLATLQIYKADGFKARQMAQEAETFRRVTMKVLSMQLNSIIIMDVIAYGGAAAGIALALLSFYAGELSVKNAFICILLSSDFFIPLRRLGSAFHVAMNGVAASKNIFEFLDLPEGEGAARPPAESDLGQAGRALRGSASAPFAAGPRTLRAAPIPSAGILFQAKNLSCAFDRVVLKDACIEIKSGEFVAFVGKSGSGKSTAAKILCGIYRNYTGSVLLNGAEIASIPSAALFDATTYISHRDWIFAGTVRDCLFEGKENASEGEMIQALRDVRLWDFLSQNGGLDFKLNEGGSNISGGQRQRLSIARALLRGSPVYVFDEATSNIDVESESAILDLIRSLKGRKTVIMISHRAENCEGADRTYFFEDGKVQGGGQ